MADLCDRVGITLIKILALAVVGFPIVSIVLGVSYFLGDPEAWCPLQPMVPVYLIVLGSVTIAYELVCFLQVKCLTDDDNNENFLMFALGWFLSLCFIGWVITGIVFYGLTVSKRSSDDSSSNFCDYLLYTYFSSQVIMACILLTFVIFWISCLCCMSRSANLETQSIVQPVGRRLSSGRSNVQSVQRDRLAVIRRGPNLYYIYQSNRVTTIQHV